MKPLIAEHMPILIDDDLLFEDEGTFRQTVTVNRWLRELPVSGAPSPRTWDVYARVLKSWLEFLDSYGVGLLDSADLLRGALSAMAEYRMSGPLDARWDAATWNLHVSVLSRFYQWAMAEGLTAAEPFTYSWGRRFVGPQLVAVRRNNARRRTAKPHSLIKYLERDFADLFLNVVGGLQPDGSADDTCRGREVGRNSAMARAVMSSGLRRQEFTYLLTYEVPPLPDRRTIVPVQFPLGRGVTKGAKPRTTWIDYDALAELHQYIALERAAASAESTWRPPARLGPRLQVEAPDWQGALIDGVRRRWSSLVPDERLRLVAPDGSSCVVGLQSSGSPFTDWPTVFRRTSERIQTTFEPRFPTVSPHRLRHTFAMRTLEWLVDGHYQRAAALALQTDADAGLALYLLKADPLCVLRDLLGHASVTTTEIYLRRLDVMRIFHDASTKVDLHPKVLFATPIPSHATEEK
ncbi:tyrosine-type recombinase/integrase [Mycolicibacterium llatzerense]|uniref:tyrosine-type recombinase/integrase n=1 Tax=Mycolicibacterium llatzerense TaxID=280871 RepID=UPI000B00F2D5|nr:site-specific integrase [Mycolicibacterium llatzerense]